MKAPKVVLVEWVDSSGTGGWQPLTQVVKMEPDRCISVGFVVNETDKYVTLIQSFTNRKDSTTDEADHALTIPKRAITRIVTVRK